MKQPQEIKRSQQEGEAFIERLDSEALTAHDRRLLVQLMPGDFWRMFA